MVASYHAFGASFDGTYFTSLAAADYYEKGGEPPGQWFGAGAALLGLTGTIDGNHLRRLLAGYHPSKPQQLVKSRRKPSSRYADEDCHLPPDSLDSPERLPRNSDTSATRNQSKDYAARCPAYDITFSAPKSVSVLWAVGDERIQSEVTAAMDVAVKRTLAWLEYEVLLGRSGKNRRYHQRAKLVIGMYDHSASRAKSWQPQLHRHAVLINACQLANGRWAAIDSFELSGWIRLLGPLFRVELARELKQRLGVELDREISPTGADAGFHVRGIGKDLCKHWSSRREELLDMLDGGKIRLNKGTAQARQLANQLSRKPKEAVPPRAELISKWTAEASRFGVTREAIKKLLGRSQPANYQEAYRQAWQSVIKRLTNTTTDFTYRQILQAIAEEIQHLGIDAHKLARRVKRDLKRSPDIVRLGPVNREIRFTTKENWDLEEALLKQVQKMSSRPGCIVPSHVIDYVLKRHPELDTEQQTAVRHNLTQHGALRALTGVGGSGKSWTVTLIREAFERTGRTVRGGAVAGQAKEELAAKSGVESRTIESYLYHLEKSTAQRAWTQAKHIARQLGRAAQNKPTWNYEPVRIKKNSVLILDEAGMMDTRTMLRILRQAEKVNATVVMVGDTEQLPPVGVGAPLPRILKIIGNAHLTKNYRQKDPEDVAAGLAIREGDATKAIKSFVRRGRLTIGRDRRDTIYKLVDKWIANGGPVRPKDHFCFCETREESRVVNRLMQRARLERQRIPSLLSVRSERERFYRGDRVMFHIPLRNIGGIENGYRGTILAVNPLRGQIVVRLDRKPLRKAGHKPQKQIITVSVKAIERAAKRLGRQGITLAYAGTTHKLQGGSTPTAYMLMGGPLTAREMAYTQATRGIEKTFVFVDKQHAGKDLKDLVKSIRQSRAKRLAHDLVDSAKSRGPTIRHEYSIQQ